MKKFIILLATIFSANAMAGLCAQGDGVEANPMKLEASGNCGYSSYDNDNTVSIVAYAEEMTADTNNLRTFLGTIATYDLNSSDQEKNSATVVQKCQKALVDIKRLITRASVARLALCVTDTHVVLTSTKINELEEGRCQ